MSKPQAKATDTKATGTQAKATGTEAKATGTTNPSVESLSRLSERCIPKDTVEELDTFVLDVLNKDPKRRDFSDDEKKTTCRLVARTFASPLAQEAKEAFAYSPEQLLACLQAQPFEALMMQAQCVRVNGSIGYMAPETYSRTDIIQVALWLADWMERNKSPNFVFTE